GGPGDPVGPSAVLPEDDDDSHRERAQLFELVGAQVAGVDEQVDPVPLWKRSPTDQRVSQGRVSNVPVGEPLALGQAAVCPFDDNTWILPQSTPVEEGTAGPGGDADVKRRVRGLEPGPREVGLVEVHQASKLAIDREEVVRQSRRDGNRLADSHVGWPLRL